MSDNSNKIRTGFYLEKDLLDECDLFLIFRSGNIFFLRRIFLNRFARRDIFYKIAASTLCRGLEISAGNNCLTREDAERLGYVTPEMWRNLIMRHTDDIAKGRFPDAPQYFSEPATKLFHHRCRKTTRAFRFFQLRWSLEKYPICLQRRTRLMMKRSVSCTSCALTRYGK